MPARAGPLKNHNTMMSRADQEGEVPEDWRELETRAIQKDVDASGREESRQIAHGYATFLQLMAERHSGRRLTVSALHDSQAVDHLCARQHQLLCVADALSVREMEAKLHLEAESSQGQARSFP